MLICLSGLPGVGKTAMARNLAVETGAVHLRIDSIEQALRNEGVHVEGEGDIAGHRLPTWQDVLDRDYETWTCNRIVIDTAKQSIAEAVQIIRAAILQLKPGRKWVPTRA